YINTTGVGIVPLGLEISGANAQPGDIVILSGSIGDHGIAVLEARQELGFTSGIQSDIAPLNQLVVAILNVSNQVHTMRDPTRGGLATSLNEIARQSKVCIFLDENSIPIKPGVASACEILGFDPLFIANEGKLIVIVGRDDADNVIEAMHAERYGEEAVIIGEVKPEPQSRVLMRTPIGSTRVVGILSGEMLPRIC
ncbi:MAG: AIR synthase-related protein, partial [Anaerolineales bacterium]